MKYINELSWLSVKMHKKGCSFRCSWEHLQKLKWPFNWSGRLCNCSEGLRADEWLTRKLKDLTTINNRGSN